MAQNLDETDLQILKTLQKNAKLTTKELADAVHLTATPVFERQKRLEKKGYIKTYVGHGQEQVLLQDWATLHLDVLAEEKGLSKHGNVIVAQE